MDLFSRVLRDSTSRFVGSSVSPSIHPSVGLSVGPSVHHTSFFLLHCSCSNDLATSITAPAHPHATGVAVYSALFLVVCTRLYTQLCPSVGQLVSWSVGRLVGRSPFYFFWVFAVFGLTAPAQMMEWPQIWPLPTHTRLG